MESIVMHYAGVTEDEGRMTLVKVNPLPHSTTSFWYTNNI